MSDESRVFDEGMQLERTALAWQRTLLSLAVASLAVGRGLFGTIGASSWVVAGVGVTVTIALFAMTRRRYSAVHRHLTTIDATSLPSGGRLMALCATLAVLSGVAAAAFVLLNVI